MTKISLSTLSLVLILLGLGDGLSPALGQTVVSRSADDRAGRYALAFENGELFYDGSLQDRGVVELIALYAASVEKPSVLAIRSTGGSTAAGIALGSFVFRHQMSVRIVDYCGSACANYVFPAGVRKTLTKNAVVWWHGSMWSKSWSVPGATDRYYCQSEDACGVELAAIAKEKYRCKSMKTCEQEKAELAHFFGTNFDSLRKAERELFTAIDIDPAVTVYGNDVAPCGCVWTFNIDDLRRFRISNVAVGEGSAYASKEAKKTHKEAQAKVVILKLP